MRELVDALDGTWRATSAVLHEVEESAWDRPTGCPGWSVKDQLAHMLWSARLLVGEVPPEIEVPPLDHVHGPVAEYMERDVHARRDVPGEAVLAEFDQTRARAIADLRDRGPEAFDEPFTGPMGMEMTRSRYLPIAVFDQYAHGEDIRAALDLPADIDSPAADRSFEQIGRAVGGRLELPVEVARVEHDRVELRVGAPNADATLTWPAADLVSVATGRTRPTADPVVTGDDDLARTVLEAFPVTP